MSYVESAGCLISSLLGVLCGVCRVSYVASAGCLMSSLQGVLCRVFWVSYVESAVCLMSISIMWSSIMYSTHGSIHDIWLHCATG